MRYFYLIACLFTRLIKYLLKHFPDIIESFLAFCCFVAINSHIIADTMQ